MQKLRLSFAIVVAAVCCVPAVFYAGPEPIPGPVVEIQTEKNVVTQEKPNCWAWYTEAGYESEYNFRGTNLTPNADGAMFFLAQVSRWNFTLGLFEVHQLGTSDSPSFSLGEGGGGGTGGGSGSPNGVGTYAPKTVQTDFNELDLFLQYSHEFGPIDVTVGNIGFFIQRTAQTFLDTSNHGLYGPYPTVGDEQFDRIFLRVATSIIPHLQPWITYYQTIYSEGQDHEFYLAPHIPPLPPSDPFSKVRYGQPGNPNYHERNDELGGYLEGRLRGTFSLCEWIDFDPYGVISYSFRDRSKPVNDPNDFSKIIRGRPLTGFNVAQAGFELPIHLLHIVPDSNGPCRPADMTLNLVPFGAYSYHISEPTAGTDRNEVWGGVKLALTF